MRCDKFKICLNIKVEDDAALKVVTQAQRCFSFDSEKLLTYRLAIHEAVLNALKYGGGEAVLTAFDDNEKMQVEIRQKNKIVFPSETKAFQGVSLIRRYAKETEVSADGKTLILRFY